MLIGIYPGSFDPATNGHFDIIKRASNIVDILIVGVLNNVNKTPLFTPEERIEQLKYITRDIKNVKIDTFSGLLIDFATKNNAKVIIRGLRAVTDFEYELQMSQTNRSINREIETIFLSTSVEYSYLSSSIIKQLANFSGNIDAMVDPFVKQKLIEKIKEKY